MIKVSKGDRAMLTKLITLSGILISIIVLSVYGLTLRKFQPDSVGLGTYSQMFFFSISFICSLVGAILSINVSSKIEESYPSQIFNVFCATIVISSMEILYFTTPISQRIVFITSVIGNSVLIYSTIKIGMSALRINEHFSSLAASIPSGIVLLIGVYREFVESSVHPTMYSLAISFTKSIPLAFFPVLISFLVIIRPSLRLDKRSIFHSIQILLFHPGRDSDRKIFWLICWLNIILLGGISFYISRLDLINPQVFPLKNVDPGWIACILYILTNQTGYSLINRINRIILSLTSKKQKRFFSRQSQYQSDNWAATVGLKTAIFLIDHDPKDEAGRTFTSSLCHIRKEEIVRFSQRILGDRVLHTRSSGNQLSGIIDHEDSNHPCVDVLTLFACIYLDVVPLIERRLKGLASLFPIIEPDLAERLRPKVIEDVHARLEWLYHFDYNWVDQQMTMSGSGASYGVSIDQLGGREKNAILTSLQGHNRIGNFIWIGELAKNRIQIEAPHLASIIETWPININDSINTIYLIKFEDLIPRLQTYYFLQSSRSILRDFDLNQDAVNILKMLNYQFDQNLSYERIMDIVDSIGSYQWNGFREKDLALELVLKAYYKISDLYNKAEYSIPDKSQWHRIFFDVVQKVGYPSQILHLAHLKKHSIRNMEAISSIVSKPHHPRFSEAWLYLCSAEPQMYTDDEVEKLISIFNEVLDKPKINCMPIVQNKISEAFLNFSYRLSTPETYPRMIKILEKIICFTSQKDLNPETMVTLLDGKSYLESTMNVSIELSKETWVHLDLYFQNSRFIKQDYTKFLVAKKRWRSISDPIKKDLLEQPSCF